MGLNTIEQLMDKGESELNNRDKILLKEFNLLLTKNIKYSRGVKFYAEHLAITPRKLNILTKEYYGITAKVFIEERIIIDSKKLLLETPETVKQISYNLGFTEQTNFNKFFKKNTATTPLQYREQYNKSTF
ncbi:MAG: helix-turn-helix domain-containing protein [Melioribacteraceae bacterium]